ncbi:hypothetical protein [Lactococcus phage CHPC971]|uniref:Uncharacterized protein n=2 Tax=Fremauxvirus CHPC971 TaxID=2845405 RepID=A0A649V1Q8_9CAUD|nr:hypothetical protein KMD16_gp28 [Lactococcus phage CHPC971]QCW07630.1 hypothetical protein [Lactococcus phage CHPC971]QGJ84777.1 hypothetical protein [Lactococcus phage P1046]
MRLKQYLKKLNVFDVDYDVSFILHDYNDIEPDFFYLSWLSDNAYNKLYPTYSIEDPDATLVVDIAQIKHIKTIPDWLLDIPGYCYSYSRVTRDELGINMVDIEIYTDRIMHLYLQNNKKYGDFIKCYYN